MAPDGVNQLQVAAELKAPVTIVALTTLLRDSEAHCFSEWSLHCSRLKSAGLLPCSSGDQPGPVSPSVSVTIRSMREREVPAKEVRPCSLEFKRLGRALQSSRTE